MGDASVTVLFFAMLRERRGRAEERVAVHPGEAVGALYSRLFPPGPGGALPVGFAVNQAYVGADHPLSDGDEVAFIPPLGGG